MKVSDFKKLEEQRLEELRLSSFIGDVGSAFVKGGFTGKGYKQQLEQDMFLKDFYDDAYTSLDNAIKGKLVDPNASGSFASSPVEKNPADVKPAPGEPGAPVKSTAPATPTAPGTPAAKTSATAGAVAAKKAQQQTTQNINNYVKQAAQAINQATDKNQKIALTKELVNAMADRQGTPEWNNAVKGVEGIIRRAGTDPNFANAAVNNLRSGKTMSEAWRIYFANKLVEAVGLTWKDLGLSVLKEGKNYYIAETRYHRMNQLFESIMEVTTGGASFGAAAAPTATVGKAGTSPASKNINTPSNATLSTPTVPKANTQQSASGGLQSVGEFMLDWFNQYMSGVDWKSKESIVLPMIQDIENSYPGGYKKAIKTLANTAYALSKSSPKFPKGIEDELANMDSAGGEKSSASVDFGAGAHKKPETGEKDSTAPKTTTTTESRRRR